METEQGFEKSVINPRATKRKHLVFNRVHKSPIFFHQNQNPDFDSAIV